MNGQTHLSTGAGIGLVFSLSQDPIHMIVLGGMAAISSLAPDLDGESLLNSKMAKVAKRVQELGLFIGLFAIALAVSMMVLEGSWFSFLPATLLEKHNILLIIGIGCTVFLTLLKKRSTMRNVLMCLLGLVLLYYGSVQ